jgi:hypothetical protein
MATAVSWVKGCLGAGGVHGLPWQQRLWSDVEETKRGTHPFELLMADWSTQQLIVYPVKFAEPISAFCAVEFSSRYDEGWPSKEAASPEIET